MAGTLFVISPLQFLKPVCSLPMRAEFEEDLDRSKTKTRWKQFTEMQLVRHTAGGRFEMSAAALLLYFTLITGTIVEATFNRPYCCMLWYSVQFFIKYTCDLVF